MTDRFLFWIDSELIHFPLAKFLQSKYDADFFAIIDIPQPSKKFFLEQKLVKFQKVWYYRDNVSTQMQKPDLNYLASFEKKYEINLWQLAFNDRYFFRYNKHHKFTEDEILWILEQECKLFEKIVTQVHPDFFLVKLYAAHHTHLLYKLCESVGTKILMLTPTRLAKRSTISSHFDTLNSTNIINETVENQIETKKDLENFIENIIPEREKISQRRWTFKPSLKAQIDATLKFFVGTDFTAYRNYFPNYGKTRWKVMTKRYSVGARKSKSKSFLEKNSLNAIPPGKSFVFFPLHVEPERTISIDAPFHTNQIEIISNIAKSIPINFELFVKEHPHQINAGGRDLSFYKKILELPNVRLIHPSVPSKDLMKKCSLIITINGTVGLEGQFYGKPVITFVDTVYSSLPTVYRLKNFEELPKAIRFSLKKTVDPAISRNFKQNLENNTFEFSWDDLSLDMAKKFFYGGFFGEVQISSKQMEEFMKEKQHVFEFLADEHLKKINLYKKSKNN